MGWLSRTPGANPRILRTEGTVPPWSAILPVEEIDDAYAVSPLTRSALVRFPLSGTSTDSTAARDRKSPPR